MGIGRMEGDGAMKLRQVKEKMKSYRDLIGGDLIGLDDIDGAKNKEELREILNTHDKYLECLFSQAQKHLREFRKQIDLL